MSDASDPLDTYEKVEDYVKKHRRFPLEVSDFWMSGREGRTVAHLAVYYMRLPASFKDYHLADQDGWTVAHTAAQQGHLPEDFEGWHISTLSGITVLSIFVEYGMPNHANRASLFDVYVWPDVELTVAEYILGQRSHCLREEVLAWQSAKEIKANLKENSTHAPAVLFDKNLK